MSDANTVSHNWKPNQVGNRDQILAILRDAAGPMTATDIGEKMSVTYTHPCAERCLVREYMNEQWRGASHSIPGLDVVTRTGRGTHPTSKDLAAMQKVNLVTRQKIGQSVFWSIATEDLISAGDLSKLVGAV